uniref:KIB1-4 beta-propeller domain-containing protein n=1 Tax=Oryza meridionalis TaxID=40149 RepID=A0A0E0DLU5_9ORYZ
MEGASSSGALPLPLPLLVHDLGTHSDDSQTQFSICNQALSTAAIELLRDFRCFETPQGWVLALNPASLQTFLWRPQDSKKIDLPTAKQNLPRSCKCLLSSNPISSSSDCAVLVLDLDTPAMLVCKIGGSEWDSFSYELSMVSKNNKTLEVHMAKLQGIAAVAGKVYYTFSGDALGVIEFSPEVSLSTMDVDMVELPASTPNFSTYLIESCGELFLVVVFFLGHNLHRIAEVAVYKMDFSGPEWCKVDGIGDRVFLLGGDFIGTSNFGASCSASDHGLSGNCIYFVNNIAAEDNFVHVIDFEKGTEEVLRPFRHKGYPLPLRPPFWLLTTHD